MRRRAGHVKAALVHPGPPENGSAVSRLLLQEECVVHSTLSLGKMGALSEGTDAPCRNVLNALPMTQQLAIQGI